ncbi:MAG: DUF2634 domain-containing protein [Oscillospiraceae bacterium]|nr:DUF2634 domain-containing protein [Oscillospiraceae bacterium]
MIPGTSGFLQQDFELEEQPSYTFKLNNSNVRGYADGLEAVKQAICKILLTERYQYVMYSANYGIELLDLFGQPASYVCPELERRITEALTWDDRIESVSDFEFDLSKKGTVGVSFTAHTVFGDVRAEREVNV